MAIDPINFARTTQVRLRRGTTGQIAANQPVEAEPFYDLTAQRMGIGGGSDGIVEQWKSQFLEHTADVADAVPRNLQEKLTTEIISVKDFGAVGDGVTDDTAAIQKAIDESYKVRIPGGVYKITGTINNPAYFVGDGQDVVTFICDAGAGTPAFKHDSIKRPEFGGFTCEIVSGYAWYFGGVWEGNFHDIRFTGAVGSDAIKVFSKVGYGSETNRFVNLALENNGLTFLLLSYFNNNTFINCVFFGEDSYFSLPSTSADTHGNMMISPLFQQCNSISNADSQKWVLINPYIEDCNLTGYWDISNAVQNGGDNRSRLEFLSGNSGVSYGTGGRNVSFRPEASDFNYLSSIGDERYTSSVGKTTDVDGISVTGYIITRSGSGAFSRQTIIGASAELDRLISAYGGVTVSFDAKRNSGTAGSVEFLSGEFYSPSVDSSDWQRYTYRLTSAGSFLRVYYDNADAGSISFCNVSIRPGLTAGLSNPQQFPYMAAKASATYNPPSLNSGESATTTVSCTGAALGDIAIAGFNYDLQGVNLSAWVNSLDSVSVRFENNTGGTVDLNNGTINVTVLKA